MDRNYLIGSASALALLAAMPGAQAATSDASQISILKRQIQAQQQQLQQQQQVLDNLIANQQQTKADVTKLAATTKPAAKPSAVAVMSANHTPGWRSADGKNEIDLGSLLQVDFGTASYRPEFKSGAGTTASYQKMSSGWNARRAQIQVSGTFDEDFHFALQYDFGGSNESFGITAPSSNSGGVSSGVKTALFTYTGFKPYGTNLSLEFGYTAPPTTIDSAIPSNSGLFIEHPSPDRMQTFEAGPGIPTLGFRDFTNRFFLYYAFAGTRSGGEHDQGADVFTSNGSTGSQVLAAEGRISGLVISQPNLKFQLGGAFERTLQPGTTASFSDNAEDRVDQTNIIGFSAPSSALNPVTAYGDYTFEAAGEVGPFFMSGAYIHYDIERKGLKENDFWGSYGDVMYSITGEKHPYLASSGGWGNLVPAHPFNPKTGGWGAWEVGARLSYINMNSNPVPFSSAALPAGAGLQNVDGGHVYQTDLGVNWYVNNNVRMQFNWIHGVQGGLPGTTRPTNVSYYAPTLQNGNKATIYNAHWDEFAMQMQYSF